MKKYVLASVTSLAFIFAGCGGSLLDSFTGVFVDDVVSGLSYECSSGKTDVTNDNGEYTCPRGDSVTFSVGGYTLGTVTALDVVTPYSLVQNDSVKAVNIARLLQGMDDDGDPSNGINLQQTKVDAFRNKAKDDFNMEEKFDKFFEDIHELTPPSPEKAKEHMDDAIAKKGVYKDGNLFEDDDAKLIAFQGELMLTNSEQLKVFKKFYKNTADSNIIAMDSKDSIIYFVAYDEKTTSTSLYAYDTETKKYETLMSFNKVLDNEYLNLKIIASKLFLSKSERDYNTRDYSSEIIEYDLSTKEIATTTINKVDSLINELLVLNNELLYLVYDRDNYNYSVYSYATNSPISNTTYDNFNRIRYFNNSIYFVNHNNLYQLKSAGDDTYEVSVALDLSEINLYDLEATSDYIYLSYYNNGYQLDKIDSSNTKTNVGSFNAGNFYSTRSKLYYRDGNYDIYSIDNQDNTTLIPGFTTSTGYVEILNISGDYLYFIHNTGNNSAILYKTNGITTQNLKEFDYLSYRDISTMVDGNLYTILDVEEYGAEIWKIDADSANLELDFNKNIDRTSSVTGLTNVDGRYYFFANDGETGVQLYRSDKTLDGTEMIKELETYSSNGPSIFRASSEGFPYIVIGQNIYYANTRTDSILNRCDLNLENCQVIDNSSSVESIIKTDSDYFYYNDDNSTDIHKSDGSLVTNSGGFDLTNIYSQIVFNNKIYLSTRNWDTEIYVLDMQTDTINEIQVSDTLYDAKFYKANGNLYIFSDSKLYKFGNDTFTEVSIDYGSLLTARQYFTVEDKLYALVNDRPMEALSNEPTKRTYSFWLVKEDDSVEKQENEIELVYLDTYEESISRQDEGLYFTGTKQTSTSCKYDIMFTNGEVIRDLSTLIYSTFDEGEYVECGRSK